MTISIIFFALWIITAFLALRYRHNIKKFIKGQDMILYADMSMLKDMGVTPKETAEYYLIFLQETLPEDKYEDYIRGLCKINDVTYKTKAGKATDETIGFLVTSLTYDAENSYDHIEYYKEKRRKKA